MSNIVLGLLRETKTPPDKRVPLTPAQCLEVQQKFPNVEIIVEKSDIRAYQDSEYQNLGFKLVDKAVDADILMGVKEVKIEALIPNKKYFFFSHTFKKQPYNKKLLQAILANKIQLIDYEVLTDKNKNRIIGFGRYAGIVGAYNAFLAYGKKHGLFELKPAHQCKDKKELEVELKKVKLSSDFKVVITGHGRVGSGAMEIINALGLRKVSPEEYLTQNFNEPVCTQLEASDYYAKADGGEFNSSEFYKNGQGYISTFSRYLHVSNVYIPCHYWGSTSPFIVTQADLASPNCKTTIISDVSCDIAGPIACTIRPSTIADPFYGYNPKTGQESNFMDANAIGVCAVDNLPCELPRDASEGFGKDLINNVFPFLFGDDPDNVIGRASETDLNGQLTQDYAYLTEYVSS